MEYFWREYLTFEFAWNADKSYQISQVSGRKQRYLFVIFSSLDSLPVLADVSCGCSVRWNI